MEEITTHISPSSPMFTDIIPLKEEYKRKSGINIIQNQCELCGKILSNKKNLKKHLKLHSNVRNYICKICNKSYKRSDHLRRHMISHHPETNYYECELCLKQFSLNSHLTSHMKNVHGQTKLKVYNCPDCDLYFQKKSKLLLHQKNFHNAVLEKIPCYYPCCNKSYISEQKLNIHILKFHMSIINNPNNHDNIFKECDNDNKEFESENSSTSNKEKKYFKCPYSNCLKVFSSQCTLSVHIKMFHLKIKSYICSLCPKKYFHIVSLKRHLKIEHNCNIEQLREYLDGPSQKNNEIKEEIIQEVKKNLEDEGIYPKSTSDNKNIETNEDINNNSRKNSDNFKEKKNNECFLEEFNNNMINEINLYEGRIGSADASYIF